MPKTYETEPEATVVSGSGYPFRSTQEDPLSAPDAPPHGWVQWKGTSVCMDIHCECGAHLHIDEEFAYFVRCEGCKTVWEISGYVRLFKVGV